jgi:uncharacterized protein YxeA
MKKIFIGILSIVIVVAMAYVFICQQKKIIQLESDNSLKIANITQLQTEITNLQSKEQQVEELS